MLVTGCVLYSIMSNKKNTLPGVIQNLNSGMSATNAELKNSLLNLITSQSILDTQDATVKNNNQKILQNQRPTASDINDLPWDDDVNAGYPLCNNLSLVNKITSEDKISSKTSVKIYELY